MWRQITRALPGAVLDALENPKAKVRAAIDRALAMLGAHLTEGSTLPHGYMDFLSVADGMALFRVGGPAVKHLPKWTTSNGMASQGFYQDQYPARWRAEAWRRITLTRLPTEAFCYMAGRPLPRPESYNGGIDGLRAFDGTMAGWNSGSQGLMPYYWFRSPLEVATEGNGRNGRSWAVVVNPRYRRVTLDGGTENPQMPGLQSVASNFPGHTD
ncbi:uncharacterized protein PpBr36_05940 [Pyricularia pennisetigena]|uniref:uncharacterized protein n=1 Tax=Pyricularia pennisetigena TaxID=1578925 RepID=UPI001150D30D|nr:uncharacterized protein PpBr36_05940 [Pyricularia pennisetigena]TLS22717.1 hypothetical protein PpBr36_05940 [Pyricularia pennisetigena]